MRSTLQNALFTATLVVAAECVTCGQGTFQNLGFESASIVPIPGDPYGRVQFSPAFPGWTGYVGPAQATAALYNSYFLGTSAISILNNGWPYPFGGVIEGNYTVLLQAGVIEDPNPSPADTTLLQTAIVPNTAQSLRFRAQQPGSLSPAISLEVTLGGEQLLLTPLGSGANYTLYGADIHMFASRTAELSFTVPSPPDRDITYVFLDSIQFSDQPVPEPGIFGLCALGVVMLGWRALRRR